MEFIKKEYQKLFIVMTGFIPWIYKYYYFDIVYSTYDKFDCGMESLIAIYTRNQTIVLSTILFFVVLILVFANFFLTRKVFSHWLIQLFVFLYLLISYGIVSLFALIELLFILYPDGYLYD